ncbi:MAG TPA: hypothetical protein VF005_07055 [Acidimicrobiales bacterium]
MSAVVRIVVLVGMVGVVAGFSWPGVFTEWRLGRGLPDGDATDDSAGARSRRVRWRDGVRRRGTGRAEHGADASETDKTSDQDGPQSDFDRLFSATDRLELEAAFAEAQTQELEHLRALASEAAARLGSSAVPVHEVCSIGAGHRAETLRVRFADGTTVVLCCRGSSGSYWVQALRRQILLGSVVLDRMTFGLAGPVVVFGTPAGEVFVMADLVTIGS